MLKSCLAAMVLVAGTWTFHAEAACLSHSLSPSFAEAAPTAAAQEIEPAILVKLIKYAAAYWGDSVGRCWQSYFEENLTIVQDPCACEWTLELNGQCIVVGLGDL